jgi:CubicO group peptidase (beta-lactamase class C family)
MIVSLRRVSLALLLVVPGLTYAQSPGQSLAPDSAVLAVLRARVDAGRAAGIVVALIDAYPAVRSGAAVAPAGPRTRVVAYGRGAGGSPLDAHSLFEIGSITKTFTSVALALMAADGTVRLDQPVVELLPNGAVVPSRDGRPIRLVDLATQTSGLPRLPDNLKPRDFTDPYADYDGARLLAFLAQYALPRDPGAQYEYSNLGAGLLGYALARRADVSYEQLVRERILRPLSMTETAITLDSALRARFAPGHDAKGAPVHDWTFDALAGAGAIRSTATDMARYIVANLEAARGEGTGPLNAALAATHARRADTGIPNLSIGLAWHRAVRPDGDTVVWHNGQTGGYASFVGFSPRRAVGIVVLSNSSVTVDDLGAAILANMPLSTLAAAPLAPPRERTAIALPAAALERFVGAYPLAPTFVLTVRREGDHLFAQATGQPAAELFAESPTNFFLRVVDAQIEFQTDSSGAVTGLVLVQNGRRLPATKRAGTSTATPAHAP